MGKSHGESTSILERLKGSYAPAITATYISLLRLAPTSSEPTNWIEWGVADTDPPGSAVPRVRVFDAVQADTTLPYWSSVATYSGDPDRREIHNINGVSWNTVTLPATQSVVAVGVFKTASTSYTYNSVSEVAESDSVLDLVYWDSIASAVTVANGETVLFMDSKIRVTEK